MRIVSLIICIGFLVLSKYIPKYKKIFIALSAIFLLAFWSIRGNILNQMYAGVDYNSYKSWFSSIENLPLKWYNDIGFNILLLLIKRFTNSFDLFIFITTAFFIYAIYKYAIENNKEYVLTIYIFISFGIFELGLSSIRQWIAGSIFLLSIKYIREKQFWRYLVSIIIASLFHNSAVVLIAIYPFINLKANNHKLKILLCLICGILGAVLIKTGILINLIYKIAPLYAPKYVNIGPELNSNYTVFIISSVALGFIMINKKAYSYFVEKYNYQVDYLTLLWLFAFLATYHFMMARLMQYFMPAIPLVVPNMLQTIENKKVKKILTILSICFFAATYIF